VIIVAGLEFLNYVLLRLYANRGLYYTAQGGAVGAERRRNRTIRVGRAVRAQPGGQTLEN
jgi:hypothetical protein